MQTAEQRLNASVTPYSQRGLAEGEVEPVYGEDLVRTLYGIFERQVRGITPERAHEGIQLINIIRKFFSGNCQVDTLKGPKNYELAAEEDISSGLINSLGKLGSVRVSQYWFPVEEGFEEGNFRERKPMKSKDLQDSRLYPLQMHVRLKEVLFADAQTKWQYCFLSNLDIRRREELMRQIEPASIYRRLSFRFGEVYLDPEQKKKMWPHIDLRILEAVDGKIAAGWRFYPKYVKHWEEESQISPQSLTPAEELILRKLPALCMEMHTRCESKKRKH